MSTFWFITDADKQVGIGLKEDKSRLKPATGLLSNQLSINIASHGYERLSAFGEKLSLMEYTVAIITCKEKQGYTRLGLRSY